MIFMKDLVADYPYKTTPNVGLVEIRKLGLSNDHYGGNIYPYACKLKNGMYLIVNMQLETIDVALDTNDLSGVDGNILKKVAKQNGIAFDWKNTTKEELIGLIQAKFTA